MNILVFDIETIPDVTAGRKLYDLPGSDAEVGAAMFAKRAEETGGSEFLRHHLHKVAAISVVLRQGSKLKVWSIGDLDSSEADILQRFFDGIDRYTPTIVSWNGSGFDLPVLHYRSLVHGINAARYWEKGENDQGFRWNNYTSRFHERHTDLMDVLAGYTGRANVPLDQMATMLGFPGKMGMSGDKVWDNYLAGDLAGIRDYCETDVLNTYLVYLRFLLIQGKLSEEAYQQEYQLVLDTLQSSSAAHLQEFAANCQT
jgi:predicted PolB exonuclease-like 3'-5' exonuclease